MDDVAASPGQLQRPGLAAVGHLPAGNGSACLSARSQGAHSTLGLCDWRVRCAALHRLRRRRFRSTTTTARNASGNFYDHSDWCQFQCKRTAGKYARHVDRQVMAGRLLHFENDHGLIVKDFSTGGELVCCLKDCVHNFPGGAAGVFSDDVLHAAASKRFIF